MKGLENQSLWQELDYFIYYSLHRFMTISSEKLCKLKNAKTEHSLKICEWKCTSVKILCLHDGFLMYFLVAEYLYIIAERQK